MKNITSLFFGIIGLQQCVKKKLAQVHQKVGKVSGTAKKQLEEHFETNELN